MNTCPPYRPFRGAEPPHFVDRQDDDLEPDGIVAGSLTAYRCGPCDPRFHRLVVSFPAQGKTAVLQAIGRQAARELDWAVAYHRCRPKERALGTVCYELLASLSRQWPASRSALASEVLGPRLKARWHRRVPEHPAGTALASVPASLAPEAEASWEELRQVLRLAGRFARDHARGVLVVLDDADFLGAGEAELFGHLARCLSLERLPVAVLLSGGQALGGRFARAGNFSAAVWPTRLDWFDASEARQALVVPAAERGVDFQEDALALACLGAGGSPLELQRLGFGAWSAATGDEAITVADVEEAIGRHKRRVAATAR